MRTARLFLVLVALAIAGLMLSGYAQCHGQEAGCQAAEPPVGSIYCTKNLDPSMNSSWSFWNHQAEYVGNGEVVESQMGGVYGYGVQIVPLNQFLSRRYQAVVWFPRYREMGRRAAEIARTYVGRPYRPYSSLWPHVIPSIVPRILRGTDAGMNCISVERDSYEAASGMNLIGYQDPDDIYRFTNLFEGPYLVQMQTGQQ